MITNLIDSLFRHAPLLFCAALVGITIHAIADVPIVSSGRTSITAERSHYNSVLNLVTFEDDVEMTNPTMKLTCDVLDVELKDEASGPAAASDSGSIKVATATGYVVIITKNSQGGDVVAHARRAKFEGADQSVTLSDFPKLQDGGQIIEGTSPESRIILNPDGKHRTTGPCKILIANAGKAGLTLPTR